MTIHFYLFSDACPTDWLNDGEDEKWHTIVNVAFQSEPALQSMIDGGQGHEAVLAQDEAYVKLIEGVESRLPSGELAHWKDRGDGYRKRFCEAFRDVRPRPIDVAACSFQEKTLRNSRQALLRSCNDQIGGAGGGEIGFEEFVDHRGRRQMKHTFVNFYGYSEITAPDNQMLILLLTSFFVATQYNFYSKVCGPLGITVISDRLSGDDERRQKNEANLRNLMTPNPDRDPIVLARSASDDPSGVLLADNLAGWLDTAIKDPASPCADYARGLIATDVWKGWHELTESTTTLQPVPAIRRLEGASDA